MACIGTKSAGGQCTNSHATKKSALTDEAIFIKFGSHFCSTHTLQLTNLSKATDVREKVLTLTADEAAVFQSTKGQFPTTTTTKVAPVTATKLTLEQIIKQFTALRVHLSEAQGEAFDIFIEEIQEMHVDESDCM